jgi:hypothetical protein
MLPVEILLPSGHVALIDADDRPIVQRYYWHAVVDTRITYVITNIWKGDRRTSLSLHRFIMKAPPHCQVDHRNRNRNGLDNRRSNLRLATQSQNKGNASLACNNASGYKGVCWNKASRKWVAQINKLGKRVGLGYFIDSWDAAQAYNTAALEIYGEFAVLNVKKESEDNMSIFDQEAPEPAGPPVSHGESLMQAHVSAHPGFEGPELPTQDGNRYTLPDADGKPVTWNGATTLAKELDNPYAITQWQLRQAVHGVGIRPDLAKLAGAAKPDDKETLRKVVKDALAAAATEAGANEGTAWHMVFERVDRGEPIEALPEFFHAGIRSRQAELERHGIQILPEYIERAVRCLMFKVSGKLDRIGLYEGQFVIIDDKSEKDPLSYPKAKTIQMAIYAYAGELFDPATFTIEPMPDVRKDIAIMLHFDKTTHECKAYRVPIDIGWWGARLAREVREWRKMDCLIAPLVSLGSWTPKPTVPTQEEISSAITGFNVVEKERVLGPYVVDEVSDDNGHSTVDSVATETLRDDASSLDSESTEASIDQGPVNPLVARASSAVTPVVPRLSNGEPAIDPTAEAMELSETWLSTHKTKPELQQLCQSVGITDVAHHRAWLAKEYIAARNAGGQSVTKDHYGRNLDGSLTDAPYAGSEEQLRDADVIESGVSVEELILAKIDEAESKQDLQRIWSESTEAGQHPERWTDELTKAGLGRMRVVENMRPVGADSPFA